ncbi:hypothetical protein [Butyrivibrio sp. WCE2006]|uniref:hypothetical protein n=1 Tax=Butyrivibrio sp. WCE2006 TaxID=1410611 RepID=UPI0005D1A06C|nr:hypothetical protein [Butyrivibrio sp. WCE2006]
MEEGNNIKWHPGFYAGMEFGLRQYRQILKFTPEHTLAKEPIKMDLLIIKKNSKIIINNAIGRIFSTYNIVEYKSPEDNLTIDDFYKTIGYACFYKGYGERVNQIDVSNMSISIFRHKHPYKLFKILSKLGALVEENSKGVYYVNGIINIPTQIIVVDELEDETFLALKIMTKNANETIIRKFINDSTAINNKADQINVDAILQVSVSANYELYERIRRESTMCDALRELMKDDIEKEKEQAVEQGIQIFIEDKLEDGIAEDVILAKLQKLYKLSPEKAKEYYDKEVKK